MAAVGDDVLGDFRRRSDRVDAPDQPPRRAVGNGLFLCGTGFSLCLKESKTGTQAKACATLILLACCTCASAVNPSLDTNQYAHNAWTIRDGFFKSVIYTIAQTPDGYLWLGTEFGLFRFDGVRSVPWQPPVGDHRASNATFSIHPLAGRSVRAAPTACMSVSPVDPLR